MLRTRERGNQVTPAAWQRRYIRCNGDTVLASSGTKGISSPYSWIQDVPSSGCLVSDRVRRNLFKFVDHKTWKVNFPNPSRSSAVYWTCGTNQYTYYQDIFSGSIGVWHHMYPYSQFAGDNLVGFADFGSLDAAVGHYDRWQRAKPSMATRANLSVFLYELRDIRRMFNIIPWRHFSLRSWGDVRRLVLDGNGAHLNWNFGWKPFLRDLQATWKGLASFTPRLMKYLLEQGKLLTRHETDTESDGSWVWQNRGSSNPEFFYDVWKVEKTVRRSTFEFTYVIPQPYVDSIVWRGLLDTLGLDCSIANVWAVLPWSFVWDWFFGLGRHLRTYSKDWAEPEIRLVQACSSVKREGTFVMDVRWTKGGKTVTFNNFLSFNYVHYRRVPGIPTYVWANPGELSADKIRLLVSLGIPRIL